MTAKILEVQPLTSDVTEVAFDLAGQKFPFQAGQYLSLCLPVLHYEDPRGNCREFSIASSPLEENLITIAFRNSESGFKKTLRELKPGAEVTISGPYGLFLLPKTDEKPIALIAGGIGITPFVSMIRFAHLKRPKIDIAVLHAVSTESEIPFKEEMAKKQTSHIKINHFKERLNENLIKNTTPDITKRLIYLAGPLPMIKSTAKELELCSVPEDNIFAEDFFGYE